ncbi:hypothetical protein JCM10213v2_005156 [Rhodosporidiobolus nylandii]
MVSSTPSFTRMCVSPVNKGRAIGQRIRGICQDHLYLLPLLHGLNPTSTSALTAQSSRFSLSLGPLPSFSTLATPRILLLSSSRLPSTAVSRSATYVKQARETNIHNSLEFLHIIWDEAHPWQLTSWDGKEVVVHVPRASRVYRLMKTIRRKYFLGGLFDRSYRVNLYCNNHVPVTPCPVNYKRLRELQRAYSGAVRKAVANGELVKWAFDGQLEEDD